MIASTLEKRSDNMRGISLCILSYVLFSLQDASIKWIIEEKTVYEALFWRSLTVFGVCLAIGRLKIVKRVACSPVLRHMIWRAIVAGLGWVLYYTGARSMSLAEMTTIYFTAPIIVTVLAVLLLGERASKLQWAIVILGFVGVIIACQPANLSSPTATVIVLLAAFLWAYGYILIRQHGSLMPIIDQVLLTNFIYILMMGSMLPWHTTSSSIGEIAAMSAIGLIGGAGQYLLFSSFLHAKATILAPFEYTGLIWAFLLTWAIWGISPNTELLVGASIIAISGIAAASVSARSQHDG